MGFISPTNPLDEYPVIDPLYGIDGFRNVNLLSDLDNIPNLRRRAGMVVGVSGGTQYYKLNPEPWNSTISDWTLFQTGGGGGEPFTGGTVSGETIFTNGVTATTISASTYLGLPLDIYVTGGTYNDGVTTFINNTGGTFNVSGYYTGETDNNTFTTGFTYENNTFTIFDNSGNSFNATIDVVTGLTINGTLSASTYENLPLDIYVTGGTYNDGDAIFTNNTGGTFTVSGFYTGGTDFYVTGGTFDKNTETLTLSRNDNNDVQITGFTDVYTTGFTFDPSSYDISVELNDGNILTQNLSILSSDVTITGGTYDPLNGTATFTNNTGGTFNVTGFITGFTDIQVTGYTYQDNTFTIFDSSGNTFSATIDVVTGLTVNGTISATTYQNLPQDIFVTGGTYTNGEILFRNNAGSYFTVTGLPIGGAGGQVYYLNLSQTQSPYNEFSPIGSNLPEQVSAVTINSGVTSTIASFLTPFGYPNTTTIPAGYWSFYIHSYKDVISASFDVFCEVYTYSTGGTETLILTTEGADVTTYSPTVSMELTDGYYSGGTIDITDRILVKVRTTNNGSQTNTLSFFTEGQQHYSYGITPFSNFNALTCETLSGCTTIVNLENNKVNKSGDTMTGTLYVPTISATTISATTIGSSGDCVDDIYVSNIHSCSPLNINPLDEGNVYFGSTSGVTIDLVNNRVGIGNITPTEKLDVSGKTKTTNLQVTSGATAGYVLTAIDSSGNTQWVALGSNNNELDPVLTITGTTPSVVNIGDRFLISGGTGIWSGRTNQIAEYTGVTPTDYSYYIPVLDDVVFVTDTLTTYRFDGTNWISWRGTAILQNGNSLSTAVNIGSNNNQNLTLRTSGQTRVTISGNTGNVLIGSTTDTGERLQVNGNIRMSNPISTSALVFDTLAASSWRIRTTTPGGIGTVFTFGPTNRIFTEQEIVAQRGIVVTNALGTGSTFNLAIGNLFTQTIGSTDVTSLNITTSVIHSGTYSGVARGIYYNPSSVTYSGTHRAIETTRGDVIFGSTSGNVGIGTTTPTAKLDVSGKTKTINLQVTSGATTGYVLTSDSSGNATWQTPTTFTGGTVNGLTATTISATTYSNLPASSTITGGTYNFTGNTLTLNSNDGNTIPITGFTYERQSDYVYPYFYGGSAPLYTLTSTATWIIKRVDYTTPGSPITLSAIGSWDNRYILIYT